MYSLKLNGSQLGLLREALEVLYDDILSRQPFEETDADDVCVLMNLLKSCSPDPEGGEG